MLKLGWWVPLNELKRTFIELISKHPLRGRFHHCIIGYMWNHMCIVLITCVIWKGKSKGLIIPRWVYEVVKLIVILHNLTKIITIEIESFKAATLSMHKINHVLVYYIVEHTKEVDHTCNMKNQMWRAIPS